MSRTEQQAAISQLRKWLKPGDTIYTVLRSVSRSGMSRRIDCIRITENGPQTITYLVAQVLGCTLPDKGDGLRVNGCGMDMGFHTVYALGRVLWPKGTDYISGRNGSTTPEPDGGYALKQRWL